MDPTYNVEVSLKINNADGTPFAEHGHKFSGMSIKAVNYLQKMGTDFLNQLQKIGESQAGQKS